MPSDTHIATREPFQLGPWRVEPGLCEISSEGNAIHLEPRTMAVLCFLAARAQQTVSRDDLLDDLWKTRFVVEDALTRCISQLRQHLGDDPRNPRFIQTVPKVGYRLLVAPEPLRVEADAPPSAPAPAAARSPDRVRVYAIVAVLALLAIAVTWQIVANRGPSHARADAAAEDRRASIAILPFVVVGDSADARNFADGMTEDLIQLLATVPDIRVASRTSSYYFKDKQADLATIAHELGVGHVLEGSVRRERDRIIVKAQLIDAASDAHIWAQEYDRELHDLFEVQKEITVAVAQRLELSVGRNLLRRAPDTRNMGAYQMFVEARLELNKYEQGAAQNSIGMLEAVVDLDPQFAGAWSTLALAHWVSPASTPMTPEEILASDEAARGAARRALSIDASSSNAQFVLADSARVSYDFIDAEKRYRQALTQAPANTALQVGYGNLLGDTGRVRNSMTRRQLSFHLDPLSPISAFFLARGNVLSDQLPEARKLLQRSRELGFRSPVLDHAEAYLDIRELNFAAARAAWARGDSREAQIMVEVISALEDPSRRVNAAAMIRELPPWNVLPYRGRLYAALLLGETEIALQAAEDGASSKLEPTDAWWLPEAAPLRKHPRFAALAERTQLMQYWRQYGWPDACAASGETLRCD